MIAIDSPGLILKKLKTAPAPVWIPHPKGARTERSYAASTFTSDFSSATTALEKDDWPKKCEITSAPVASLNAELPSSRRSEEHTSELQSLMRISYAVFCLKKKKQNQMHI